jgi:hypothetical protein
MMECAPGFTVSRCGRPGVSDGRRAMLDRQRWLARSTPALPLGFLFWYHNQMKSARKNGIKKRRGRPATGQGVQIGTRWPNGAVAAIDAWAAKQNDEPGRSEAIRRLVEIGLAARRNPAGRRSAKNEGNAKDLASKTIDRLEDSTAPAEEMASRKRSLLKGPEEFRELRVDRANKN